LATLTKWRFHDRFRLPDLSVSANQHRRSTAVADQAAPAKRWISESYPGQNWLQAANLRLQLPAGAPLSQNARPGQRYPNHHPQAKADKQDDYHYLKAHDPHLLTDHPFTGSLALRGPIAISKDSIAREHRFCLTSESPHSHILLTSHIMSDYTIICFGKRIA
jgi:hypothetical protein